MFNTRFVAAHVVHVLSLALWGGSVVFFSFIVAPAIFGFLSDRLPAAPPTGVSGLTPEVGRRLAGDTVGTIFPAYFVAQAVAGCLAVVTGILLARSGGDRLAKLRSVMTALALLVLLTHAFTVYPKSIEVLETHYQAQENGQLGQAAELRKQFGMWHGVSQTLNLLVIVLVLSSVTMVGLGARRHEREV